MLTHERIWKAVDLLAARNGLSASGLARRAGLDPTAFNKSKRVSSDGRLRWPSTESIAKIFESTSTDLEVFMALVLADRPPAPTRAIPLIAMSDCAEAFDGEGRPQGSKWDEVGFPELPAGDLFALELTDDRMMPIYREGDILVCTTTIPVRRGDRVILKLKTGEILAGTLRRKTIAGIDLQPFGTSGSSEKLIAANDKNWIARILWASQ